MRRHFTLLFFYFLSHSYLSGQDIIIGPGGDYTTLSQAQDFINPGDSVMILDGLYGGSTQFLYDVNGEKNAPVTIYAQTEHGVVFRGGTESIHLVNCNHLIIDGLVIEGQSGNGMNIDDGSDYTTPTTHITIQNCWFRDMPASGNRDFLKLSGLDSFQIRNCVFIDGGDGGSGVDMVGCHWGTIEDNRFERSGVTGIQAKGGTQHITMRRNLFKDLPERALNLGGSTGLEFFRPPLPNPIVDAFEAADLDVYANVFIGSRAPIAYVGCVRVHVFNNTIYHPDNWVIRILQETREPGFLTCADNSFRNNVVVLETDLREVNIGSDTDPASFIFTHNLWYVDEITNWLPDLPVTDSFQIISDPMLIDAENEDFRLEKNSPCIGQGRTIATGTLDYYGETFLSPPARGAVEGEMTTSITDKQNSNITLRYTGQGQLKINGAEISDVLNLYSINGQLLSSVQLTSSNSEVLLPVLPSAIYITTIYRAGTLQQSHVFIKN